MDWLRFKSYMMWLTLLLYVVVAIYILFYDCETVRTRRRHSPTWLDTVMSWLMWIVGHRLIINFIQLIYSLISAAFHRLTAPSPNRVRRVRRALRSHTRSRRPRSRSTKVARLMAASMVAAQAVAQAKLQQLTAPIRGSHAPLYQVLGLEEPDPPSTVTEDYVSALSFILNTTDMAEDLNNHSSIETFDTDSKPIGIDSRASACISDRISEFEPDSLVTVNKKVKTFGGIYTGKVMRGVLNWDWLDDKGQRHTHRIPGSYYIPGGGMRLLSPQHWAQERHKQGLEMSTRSAHISTNGTEAIISWDNGKGKLTVPIDTNNNVATFPMAPGYKGYQLYIQEAGLTDDSDPVVPDVAVVSDNEDETVSSDQEHPDGEDDWNEGWCTETSNQSDEEPEPRTVDFDLTPSDQASSETMDVEPDEEDKVENLSAELLRVHHQFNHVGFGKLQAMAKSGILPKRLSTCKVPLCSACLYGKATKRPWRDKPKLEPASNPIPIRYSGQCVSVDMLKSPTPGLVAQMAGFLTGKRYRYATIFVDHYSRLGYVHLQKTQSAKETLEGKALFERKCASFGIKVEHYHADNGIFASLKWKEACEMSGQGYSYSGVNAHFQSGICERRVRELQELSRTMMIHASARWPEAMSAHLWPYAIRMACDSFNESPTLKMKRTPIEIFTKTAVMPEPKHMRPFGCPVYVLDNALQTSGIKHKWAERARVGIYLGRSPYHARSIALVLNITTGRVSPQFHVKFDPTFQTMRKSFGGKSPPVQWKKICGFERGGAIPAAPPPTRPDNDRNQADNRVNFDIPSSSAPRPEPPDSQDTSEDTPESEGDEDGIRRSTRPSIPVIGNRLVDLMCAEIMELTTNAEGVEIQEPEAPAPGELFSYSSLFPINEDEDEDPILAYAASSDPDTLYYHEAMREPDADQFREACVKEFGDQWDNGNFLLKRRSEIPADARILPGVWAMKRKRKVLTGEVYKHKARLNLDGSKQVHGLDYDQTYSPTASWPAVRLQMALTLVHNWYTRQIDYVQAFPQAPIQVKQYMKLPRGIAIEGVDNPDDWVLEVCKNVYGGKAAGRQWYLHLKKKLERIGFVRSEFDECVFFRGQCMYVLYTDDSILSGPDEAELDATIAEIQAAGLGITDEGDIADFLGVHIERKNGEFHLTQPKLIDSILEDLNLEGDNVHIKDTPMASSRLLSRHLDSPEFDRHFNYRRVVGKLNFLEQSTRGDISYATHMLARFCNDPKREHGEAAKWLGRYLKGTRD